MTPNVATQPQTIDGQQYYVIVDTTANPPSSGLKSVQVQALDGTILYDSLNVDVSQLIFKCPINTLWAQKLADVRVTVVLNIGATYNVFTYLLPSTLNVLAV